MQTYKILRNNESILITDDTIGNISKQYNVMSQKYKYDNVVLKDITHVGKHWINNHIISSSCI